MDANNSEIEITPEMIEAGFQVLCNSGIADDYPEADKVLVADIFRSMIRLSKLPDAAATLCSRSENPHVMEVKAHEPRGE